MRAISPALQAKLDAGATTLCNCWRVDRRDGVSLGFTDHDLMLRFDELDFEASSGMTASALESSTGLGVDNGQAAGGLSSDAISADDLARGSYDGAAVRRWLVDWTSPELRVLMFRGEIGEVTRGSGGFEAELTGLAEKLNRPIGRAFLYSCDAELGDQRCGVDLENSSYKASGVVESVADGRVMTISNVGGFPSDWFAKGVATWTSGANVGRSGLIKSHKAAGSDPLVELWIAMADPINVGDQVTLSAGCDKRAETCAEKFANFLNFRGFPHMPGDDWVATYPNRGEGNDGGSLGG